MVASCTVRHADTAGSAEDGEVVSIGWQLERIDPAQHRGETLRLDPERVEQRVGRSAECDVVLYTASASRDHARIRRSHDGRWWLAPLPGKLARADGEPVSAPVELCEGLSIRLGGDQLRCRAAVARDPIERAAEVGPGTPGRASVWIVAAAAALATALIMLALLWGA